MPSKRSRSRPATPESIARRRAAERALALDPASWGVDAVALRLASNRAVQIEPPTPGRVARVRREDVFDRLRARGGLAGEGFEAVRRLQRDMAALHRTVGGVRDFAPRVDATRRPPTFADAQLLAGRRLAAVLDLTGPASARLLSALCEPTIALAQAINWRAVVERETGERLADAQTATLRAACENLAGAYRRLDRAVSDGRPRSSP